MLSFYFFLLVKLKYAFPYGLAAGIICDEQLTWLSPHHGAKSDGLVVLASGSLRHRRSRTLLGLRDMTSSLLPVATVLKSFRQRPATEGQKFPEFHVRPSSLLISHFFPEPSLLCWTPDLCLWPRLLSSVVVGHLLVAVPLESQAQCAENRTCRHFPPKQPTLTLNHQATVCANTVRPGGRVEWISEIVCPFWVKVLSLFKGHLPYEGFESTLGPPARSVPCENIYFMLHLCFFSSGPGVSKLSW